MKSNLQSSILDSLINTLIYRLKFNIVFTPSLNHDAEHGLPVVFKGDKVEVSLGAVMLGVCREPDR